MIGLLILLIVVLVVGAGAVRRNGAPALVLAVPFAIGVAALRGLTATLTIFHSQDEFIYHLPTIRLFARTLPFPDLVHYHDAQTPLFYYAMAVVGKIVGFELWRLRLVEVLVSYLLSVAVYELLRRRLELPVRVAVVLALLFTLSPYVLGSSFRVITDNLATLFIVLALERCLAFGASHRTGVFAAACGYAACAMLTRQSAGFLIAVLAWYALAHRDDRRALTTRLAMIAAAVIPCVPLFIAWHGLVPPNGDSASCGLCSGAAGGSGLGATTLELSLAALALYGVVLFARPLWMTIVGPQRPRSGLRGSGTLGPVLAAVAGVLLMIVAPGAPGSQGAGFIASVARHFPTLHGSSLLLWVMVPAGAAVAVWRATCAPRSEPATVFGAAFLLGTLAISHPWQKYFDPFVLLALLMTADARDFDRVMAYAGALVLAIGFVIYVADPGLHPETTASVTLSPAVPAAGAASAGRAPMRQPQSFDDVLVAGIHPADHSSSGRSRSRSSCPCCVSW